MSQECRAFATALRSHPQHQSHQNLLKRLPMSVILEKCKYLEKDGDFCLLVLQSKPDSKLDRQRVATHLGKPANARIGVNNYVIREKSAECCTTAIASGCFFVIPFKKNGKQITG